VAVEREGKAMADLRWTAENLGLTNITAVATPAERFDTSREPFDAAILDPPRKGAGPVLSRVLRNRPRRVVYVSCHIGTTARELRQVAQAGYRITDVRCFDLFPRTHHVETVITLDR
jgi:23S rRNA (uracil1939-C5)-methyltransferase